MDERGGLASEWMELRMDGPAKEKIRRTIDGWVVGLTD